MSGQYSILDHAADVGLAVSGSTAEEMFEAAAAGMFSIITDLKAIGDNVSREISIVACSHEDLLINWLQELLYVFSVEHLLFAGFSVEIHNPETEKFIVTGRCRGEKYDPLKHEIYAEVKTATYHQLTVEHTKNHWQGKIIFDI